MRAPTFECKPADAPGRLQLKIQDVNAIFPCFFFLNVNAKDVKWKSSVFPLLMAQLKLAEGHDITYLRNLDHPVPKGGSFLAEWRA